MMVGGTPGVKVKLVNDALKRNEIAVERLGVIFPVDHLPLRPVLVSEKRTWGVSHLVRKSITSDFATQYYRGDLRPKWPCYF